MKILFLDVDGVLNHVECWERIGGPAPIDPVCVAELDRVIGATGGKIVLSSSWRGVRNLEERLHVAGALRHAYAEDFRTPSLNQVSRGGIICARIRGDEIAAWLTRHPDVRSYAIVDDDGDMLPEQLDRFVQTDFHNGGLTRAIGDRLIESLNRDLVAA